MEQTLEKKADFYDAYMAYVRDLYHTTKDHWDILKTFDGGETIGLSFIIQGLEMLKVEYAYEYHKSCKMEDELYEDEFEEEEDGFNNMITIDI